MQTYLWITFLIWALSFWASLHDLATGNFEPSTPGVKAVSIAVNAVLAAWAVALLLEA